MPIFKKKPASAAEDKKVPAAKKPKAEAKKHDHAHDHAHAPAAASARSTGAAYRILMRPLVTEKFSGQTGAYAFEVAQKANKLEIRKAVKDVYGVTPVAVRVMNVPGKVVRSKTGYGKRADWRKAVVIVKKGETIDIFASKNA